MRTAAFQKPADLCLQAQEAVDQNEPVLLRSPVEIDLLLEFARSTSHGLRLDPPALECRFLYDERGCDLFEEICRLDEYYPTRTERTILEQHSSDIRAITGPVTLIELGSGSSVKTDLLLRAYLESDGTVPYVPVDVSDSALRSALKSISACHHEARLVGVNSTYEEAFPLFEALSPVMVIFLGSTIGNLDREEFDRFLEDLTDGLAPGDFFLLGADLVKEAGIIERAYNDERGITAEFMKNLFVRMNRELGSGVDLTAVEHEAKWNRQREQVELYARFTLPQTIRVGPLDEVFTFEAGDRILLEISRKFVLLDLERSLERFGLKRESVYTDEKDWFALLLLRKVEPGD
ncbi:L-histidine N(alpha)-methyltransferase [Gemmatimonadota bacterium]